MHRRTALGRCLASLRGVADEGQTILMVTHEESVALHAKRIIRMKDGRIYSDLCAAEDQARRGELTAVLGKVTK